MIAAATPIQRARAEQQLDLGLFDHLLERMPLLMRPDQVTAAVGWKRSTIYDLCDAGELDYHALPDRATERKLITRASVALLLLRTASYTAKDLAPLWKVTLPTLPAAQLAELLAAATREQSRRAHR